MKFVYTAALVLCFAALSQSLIYKRIFLRDDSQPGKCVIGDLVINPGESVKHPTKACAEVKCESDLGLATIATCDPVSALGPAIKNIENPAKGTRCEWGDFSNKAAPFPECCIRGYWCVL